MTDQTPELPLDRSGADSRTGSPPAAASRRNARATEGKRKGPSPATLTAGDRLELRVANLWYWEGYFVRRGVSLRYYDAGEARDVTDLDLLAIQLSGALQRSIWIGESKSGTGRSAAAPLDRVLWLRGLMGLVGASAAELTIAQRPAARIGRLAAGLGVDVQSVADLDRREAASVAGAMAAGGPHNEALALLTVKTQRTAGADIDLSRAFWYLRSEVWFADPWLAAKRLVALIRLLSGRYTPGVSDAEQSAVRWLLIEAVVAFSLTTARLASTALRFEGSPLVEEVAERLSEGAAPVQEVRRIAEAVDTYWSQVASKAGVPSHAIVQALGAFSPKPPDWSEAYAELLRRLGESAESCRHLPRYCDLVAASALLTARAPEQPSVAALHVPDADEVSYLLRLVMKFLGGQAAFPQSLQAVLGQN